MGSSLTCLDLYQLRLITDASRACSQVSVYLHCTRHIRYETPFCILHFSSSRNFIFGIYMGYKNGELSLMSGLRRERAYFFQLILESISFTEWLCYHSSLPMKKYMAGAKFSVIIKEKNSKMYLNKKTCHVRALIYKVLQI